MFNPSQRRGFSKVADNLAAASGYTNDNMNKLLQSRFVTNYGMFFVLLLLGAYFSFMTVAEQNPVSAGAGRGVATYIVENHPDANVMIVVPEGVNDRLYAEAVRDTLKAASPNVVGYVVGDPRDAAAELNRLGEDGIHVRFVVTQYNAANNWLVLGEKQLAERARKHPSLREAQVVKPPSYTWPTFLLPSHLLTVANQTALVAIVAIGMTLVIITAGIDLSVASLIAFAGVIAAVAIGKLEAAGEPTVVSLAMCCLLAVAACALIGAASGFITTWFDVPAFIVTLGVMQIARGFAWKVAGGSEPVRVESEAFHHLSAGADLFGIPNPVVITTVLYVAAHILMSHTTLGRYLYAVGGNPEAARLSGVPVKSVIVFAYAICGALAGLGGVLDASMFSNGRSTGAMGYELQVIAAVVVGGTSLAGGQGKMLGTLIGALILGVIADGMRLTNVAIDTQMIVFGSLIIVAVLIDKLKSRRWRSSS